jgi:hypothetical protein
VACGPLIVEHESGAREVRIQDQARKRLGHDHIAERSMAPAIVRFDSTSASGAAGHRPHRSGVSL